MVCCIVGAIDAHGQKTITTIYKKEGVSVLHITHALLLPASFVALKKKKTHKDWAELKGELTARKCDFCMSNQRHLDSCAGLLI